MRFHGINVNPVKKGYLDKLDKANEDLQKSNEENEKLKSQLQKLNLVSNDTTPAKCLITTSS